MPNFIGRLDQQASFPRSPEGFNEPVPTQIQWGGLYANLPTNDIMISFDIPLDTRIGIGESDSGYDADCSDNDDIFTDSDYSTDDGFIESGYSHRSYKRKRDSDKEGYSETPSYHRLPTLRGIPNGAASSLNTPMTESRLVERHGTGLDPMAILFALDLPAQV